jgi:hypothetical protein
MNFTERERTVILQALYEMSSCGGPSYYDADEYDEVFESVKEKFEKKEN